VKKKYSLNCIILYREQRKVS